MDMGQGDQSSDEVDSHGFRADSNTEQERQRRSKALRSLAQEPKPPTTGAEKPVTSRAYNATQARWRRFVLAGLIILLLVTSGTIYLLSWARETQPGNTSDVPTTLMVHLDHAGIYCPRSMAWSPDGGQFAVLGTSTPCIDRTGNPLDDPAPAAVNIFDARSGKVIQAFNIDRVLDTQGLPHTSGALQNPLGWSPDGKALAVLIPYGDTSGKSREALVLLSPEGTSRVITAPVPPDNQQLTWDIRAGTMAATADVALTPALSYRWTNDGHITVAAPLPSKGTGSGFTGRSPDADTFSIWQAGRIQAVERSQVDAHGVPLPGKAKVIAYMFLSGPLLWSQDGQYAASGLQLGGFLAVAKPVDPSICVQLTQNPTHSCVTDPLPLPDAATSWVLAAVERGGVPPSDDATPSPTEWASASAPLTWSPDGAHLAAILPGDDLDSPKADWDAAITILDTASGKVTNRLLYKRPPDVNVLPVGGSFMYWSPRDGPLAFADMSADLLTIWNTPFATR